MLQRLFLVGVVGLVSLGNPAEAVAVSPREECLPAPECDPAQALTRTPGLEVPYAPPIVVDGVISPGEWDGAAAVEIEVEPGWKVAVRLQHDGQSLHVLFTDLKREQEERYPEVLLDAAGDRSSGWDADDWWLHASYQDCEGQGAYNDWRCSPAKPGWEANNFPLQAPGAVEIRIAFDKVGLSRCTGRPFGIAFNVTDTRSTWRFWPTAATLDNPGSWAAARLSYPAGVCGPAASRGPIHAAMAGADLQRTGGLGIRALSDRMG